MAKTTNNGTEAKEVEAVPTVDNVAEIIEATDEYTGFEVTCVPGEFYHRGVQYFHQLLSLEQAINLVSQGYQYITLTK